MKLKHSSFAKQFCWVVSRIKPLRIFPGCFLIALELFLDTLKEKILVLFLLVVLRYMTIHTNYYGALRFEKEHFFSFIP